MKVTLIYVHNEHCSRQGQEYVQILEAIDGVCEVPRVVCSETGMELTRVVPDYAHARA